MANFKIGDIVIVRRPGDQRGDNRYWNRRGVVSRESKDGYISVTLDETAHYPSRRIRLHKKHVYRIDEVPSYAPGDRVIVRNSWEGTISHLMSKNGYYDVFNEEKLRYYVLQDHQIKMADRREVIDG